MTLTPPSYTPPTVSFWSTLTFWGVVAAAIGTVWKATGFDPTVLAQFNNDIPLILQILGGAGVLADHKMATPRKVSFRFRPNAYRAAASAVIALSLLTLTGCPPIPSPTTQPVSPVSQQLAAEQATLNTIQVAVSIGYDAFTLYIAANPNPAEAALAAKAYNATEAAIASAQSHIDAGDAASAQLALADVQAAFQSFLTSTAKAQSALHAKAATLRSH